MKNRGSVFLWSLIFCIKDISADYLNSSFSIETNGHNYQSKPAIYIDGKASITLDIVHRNVSTIFDKNNTLLLSVQLPHSSYDYSSCDGTWYNGLGHNCHNEIRRMDYFSLITSSIRLYINGQERGLQFISHNEFLVNVTLLLTNDYLDISNPSTIFSLKFNISGKNNQNYIGEFYQFISNASILSKDSESIEDISSTQQIYYVGARVGLVLSRSKDRVEGGDILDLNFQIGRHSKSTEEPRNISFTIIDTSENSYFSILSFSGLSRQGNQLQMFSQYLPISGSLHVAFDDSVPIHSKFFLHFYLNWYAENTTCDNCVNWKSYYSFRSNLLLAQTKSFSIEKMAVSPGRLIGVGEVLNADFELRLPRGKLSNFQLLAESQFSTEEIGVPLPELLFSELILPSNIALDNPLRRVVQTGNFIANRQLFRRKRRSTVALHRYILPSVTITNSGASGRLVFVKTTFGIPTSRYPIFQSSGPIRLTFSMLSDPSGTLLLHRSTRAVNYPQLSINKTFLDVQTEGEVKGYPYWTVKILVKHTSSSSLKAHSVQLLDYYTGAVVRLVSAKLRSSSSDALIKTLTHTEANGYLLVETPTIELNEYLEMQYQAEIINENRFELSEKTFLMANVSYNSAVNNTGIAYFKADNTECVYKRETTVADQYTDAGLIILLLMIGFVVGVVILIIVLLIYIKCFNEGKDPFDPDPEEFHLNEEDQRKMDEAQEKLGMTDKKPGEIMTIQDLSKVSPNHTIVVSLVESDRIQLMRDLDSLDILATIQVDQEMDKLYDQSCIDLDISLVESFGDIGTISPKAVTAHIDKYNKSVQAIEDNTFKSYKKALGDKLETLKKKNRVEMRNLLAQQREEKESMTEQLKETSCSEDDLKNMLEITEKQHQTERNDVIYRLKLEQDEQVETLRKEAALEKRADLKEAGKSMMHGIIADNKLAEDQASWLLREHQRVHQHLTQLYDDELARQRAVLEEKLDRRRNLAEVKNMEVENSSEVLKTIGSQQKNVVNRLRREQILTSEQVEFYLDQLKEDTKKITTEKEKERLEQEKTLIEKLNERKQRALEAMKAENEKEMEELEMKFRQEKAAGPVDPASYIESKFVLQIQQRERLDQAQKVEDQDHAVELSTIMADNLSSKEAQVTEMQLSFLISLQDIGLSDTLHKKLLEKHKREIDYLRQIHEEDFEVQERQFRQKMAQRKKQAKKNRESESSEQKQLRERENAIVSNLLESQVTISEEERNRIMKEHEKNMIRLENGLTLNRIRSKKLLEETLAQRKAKQMEVLQKKQVNEAQKNVRRMKERADSDEDDALIKEENHAAALKLMQKHANEQLHCLQGDQLEIETELEAVREKMIVERIESLEEQEVRLAAQLSHLQMEKTKQLSTIEEQQKAIQKLKMNLMDEMEERGVLTEAKCQRLIDQHAVNQQALADNLEAQRQKQEKALKQKLQQRMIVQEERLLKDKEIERDEVLSHMSKREKHAATIRRAVLEQKQMLEIERFRNRIERECNQALQEMRRQFDMRKSEILAENELKFIEGLVRLGHFPQSELLEVLRVLFPLKSPAVLKEILAKISGPVDDEALKKEQTEKTGDEEPNPLLEKAKIIQIATAGQYANLWLKKASATRKNKSRGQLQTLPMMGHNMRDMTPIDRPDPIGGRDSPYVEPDYDSDRGWNEPKMVKASTLPPLEIKKKKKGRRKRAAVTPEDDDYYL